MDYSKKISLKINAGYSAIQGTYISSNAVAFGYIAVILQSKSFNNSQIGLTVALAAVFSIILPPIIAMFYDRHKNTALKYIVAFMIIFTIICYVFTVFINEPIALVMIAYILVLTAAFSSMPLLNALAMQFENIGISVNYGVARGIGSIGYAVFGYLTGLIIDEFGVKIIFPLYILLLIITVFFVLIFKKPDEDNTNNKDKDKEALVSGLSVSSEWKGFYTNPACVFFFFAMICITLNHGTLDTFQVSIVKSVGGTNSDYGVVMFVMAISEIPTMFLFKYLTKRFSYVQLLSTAFIFFIIKDVVLLIAPSVNIIIAAQVINVHWVCICRLRYITRI